MSANINNRRQFLVSSLSNEPREIRLLAKAQSPSKHLIAVQSNGEKGGNEVWLTAKCVCERFILVS